MVAELGDESISSGLTTASALPLAGLATIAGYSALQVGTYWRMQFVTAGMIGGIPENCKVAELNAKDGKNIFYLPKGIEFTAIMPQDSSKGTDKEEEKLRLDNQLVLESIGKANRGGLGLSGKVRRKTQDLGPKCMDCVISTGSLNSLTRIQRLEKFNEIYRILRPGGLFVFVEPDGDGNFYEQLTEIFPEQISLDTASAGEKLYRAQQKRELKEKGNAGKPSKKKGKKARVAQEEAEMPAATTEESRKDMDSSTSMNIVEGVGGHLEEFESQEVRGEELPPGGLGSENKDTRAVESRPGITYQRMQNIAFPYITGIAVRP
jgi:SAM-dependent methyltransferase